MGDPRGGRETSAGGQVSSGLGPRPQPSLPALGPGGGLVLLWRPRPSLQLSPALAQPFRCSRPSPAGLLCASSLGQAHTFQNSLPVESPAPVLPQPSATGHTHWSCLSPVVVLGICSHTESP